MYLGVGVYVSVHTNVTVCTYVSVCPCVAVCICVSMCTYVAVYTYVLKLSYIFQMYHPYVIDTSVCYNLKGGPHSKTGLRRLAAQFLRWVQLAPGLKSTL